MPNRRFARSSRGWATATYSSRRDLDGWQRPGKEAAGAVKVRGDGGSAAPGPLARPAPQGDVAGEESFQEAAVRSTALSGREQLAALPVGRGRMEIIGALAGPGAACDGSSGSAHL